MENTKPDIKIRKVRDEDHEAIWKIIREVIRMGDTYVFEPGSHREDMLAYWCGGDKHTYVATVDGKVVGTFFLKDNFPGLGSHVANASYMTLASASGKGIGYTMGEYSIAEAKKLGYQAMQFNIVVKTNRNAIRLWEKLGFEIVGEIPDAFNHRKRGYVNAFVMWRRL